MKQRVVKVVISLVMVVMFAFCGWVEGKFFFTAVGSRSGKTMEVTEGFFRISVAKR